MAIVDVKGAVEAVFNNSISSTSLYRLVQDSECDIPYMRISTKGKGKILFNTDDLYVWLSKQNQGG